MVHDTGGTAGSCLAYVYVKIGVEPLNARLKPKTFIMILHLDNPFYELCRLWKGDVVRCRLQKRNDLSGNDTENDMA